MSELTQEIEKEEGMYVYDKKIECPVCMKEFTTKIVKTGKARFKGSEMDLRPIYEGVDTIKYDVYMCPHCGYSAVSREFNNITHSQRKTLMEEIGSKYAGISGGHDEIYSYDEVTAFVTEQIRRFKPLVCVTQDLNGEYGHGAHMLLAHAVCDAVDNSASASFCPESADKYGTYDVPKTYLHLYEQNQIKMNLRTPLAGLGGRTALEAASDAYLKHVSQQVWDFIVSDDYEHSCANFGLYRTTVGADTGNDMLEHITTYEEAERIAAEEASKAEAESKSIEEASSIAAEKSVKAAETRQKSLPIIIIALVILVVLIAIMLIIRANNARKRRMRKRYKKGKQL